MKVADNTPVIVGVGQAVERLGSADYQGKSPADIAAAAAQAAIDDSGLRDNARAEIEVVGGIRTFEDSAPLPAVFGKPDKYPLAVAARLGITPRVAILEKAGGQSPLALLADLAARIAAGEAQVALAFGSEAISTVRHLKTAGEKREWAESLDGTMEDHGLGLGGLITRYNMAHGIAAAPPAYGLLENARRARLGLDRDAYRAEMGRLFAPFTRVAAVNPWSSAATEPMSAQEIATVTERNRMIADPYPIKLVSRDQVNQGAAVLLMSVGKARELGIAEDKWVFFHGCALANERDIIERPDLGASPAAEATLESALASAGVGVDDIAWFDFYSCFPIPVFAAAVDTLGLSPDDPRGLTVTGGLCYFGGPGNNYSMHAFATMTEKLRSAPGARGLIGVNGGFLSKYGAAVLSTTPAEWKACEKESIQKRLDAAPRPQVAKVAQGEGRILSYTINYAKGVPAQAIVVGEFADGTRFLANNADPATLAEAVETDPLGRSIAVTHRPEGNRFAFDRARLEAAYPDTRPAFRDAYETTTVERRGHVLEVTINRPEQRNSISHQTHLDLDEIFNAYEADPDLWVAILTGAGDKAFCAGADLKEAARAGGAIPLSGFAGLTNRRRTKPLIAAVNGVALGGGLEISLACDMIVADPAAKFGLTEVKVGLIAGAGGAIRLPRQIPRKIAVEMLLTGRHMDVEEARGWGLVNRVSAPGEVLAEARRLADEIAACSPVSVRLTMQIIQEGDKIPDDVEATAAMLHSNALDGLMISEDTAEGLAAFAQKRSPIWKNR
ncbi:MAG: acetyl-CoA acetyltransferase [Sphingobium sp.]